MLSGDGAQPRSAALAGRLVRVLAELGLVVLEREAPALTVTESPERTALERSAAFRAYQQTTRGRTDDSWRAAHRERQPDPPSANGAAVERQGAPRRSTARPTATPSTALEGRRPPTSPTSSASSSPTCSRSSRSTPTRSPQTVDRETRRQGVRVRLRAPRRPAPQVGRGLHRPPGRRGEDLRRHAPRHRDAVRRAAARHRRGHERRRSTRSARRSATRSPASSTA